jgi:hypothetical protein
MCDGIKIVLTKAGAAVVVLYDLHLLMAEPTVKNDVQIYALFIWTSF